MKKLIFACVMLLFTVASKAQTSYKEATMTNSTVASLPLRLSTESVTGKMFAQAVVTKTSGTIGGGLALQWSNDNVNWSNVVVTGITATDTLALTNVATNLKTWYIDIPPSGYIRLRATGNNTGVANVKFYTSFRYSAKP